MAARPLEDGTEESPAPHLLERWIELEHFLSQHGVDICLLSETLLKAELAFRLANYVCHRRQTDSGGGGRYSHPGPPWYSSPLSVRFQPDPHEGYCHPGYICRHTGEHPCGLHLSFPPTDRRGPCRLFRRGIAGPDGRRPQRQTRWLELAAEYEKGKLRRDYADESSCLIFGLGTPYHQPIQLLRYSRCLGHCDNEGPPVPGVTNLVLCTKLGPPPCTHWNSVSLFLLTPTGSPWFQAHWLGQIPNSLGRSNSVRSGIAQRDSNRHVRWEIPRRSSVGSGCIYSQVSPTWRPTASDTGRHSEWNTPEEPVAEAVADHQGPSSKSRGQPPVKFGDSQAQLLEERSVEHDARIPRSWRPISVEDDLPSDESSYSVSPLCHPRGNRSTKLRESRSPCRQSWGSVSAGYRSFGPGRYWEGWRSAEVLPHNPC